MHNAKLVWITPDAEKLIGYCARVSNPANQDNPNVAGLLTYCIKKKHWSVFEMATMCLEIKTTRAISAQLLRHKTFSFQEFSQRYAVTTEVDMPLLRSQDNKDRQNSIDDLPEEKVEFLQQQIDNHYRSAIDIYNSMLDSGVAKECARSVLPLSTATRLYMSGTIRSWLHYVDLRAANGTQLEHMQIARRIGDILADQVPTVARAMWD
mgnify:CR=1 FL=1